MSILYVHIIQVNHEQIYSCDHTNCTDTWVLYNRHLPQTGKHDPIPVGRGQHFIHQLQPGLEFSLLDRFSISA